MALVTRVVCNKEGKGDGGKRDGNKGGKQAMVTRVVAMAKTMTWAAMAWGTNNNQL
jgi:hypothetical protein